MVNVGDKVKDVVTGFEGIAIARTTWLNKCVRILVQSQKLKDGTPTEHQFDEEQLKVVKAAAIEIKKEKQTGGPKDFKPAQRSIAR